MGAGRSSFWVSKAALVGSVSCSQPCVDSARSPAKACWPEPPGEPQTTFLACWSLGWGKWLVHPGGACVLERRCWGEGWDEAGNAFQGAKTGYTEASTE